MILKIFVCIMQLLSNNLAFEALFIKKTEILAKFLRFLLVFLKILLMLRVRAKENKKTEKKNI